MSDAQVNWKGKEAVDYMTAVTAEALWLMGQDALTEAMNDVPLDTGTLRRSGVVTVNQLPNPGSVYATAKTGSGNKSVTAAQKNVPDKTATKVYVSYNTPYAIWLHETNKWNPRDWKRTAAGNKVQKPAVGRWKWLSRALSVVKNRIPVYVARAQAKVRPPK